jgi:Glycosyltransferase family 43
MMKKTEHIIPRRGAKVLWLTVVAVLAIVRQVLIMSSSSSSSSVSYYPCVEMYYPGDDDDPSSSTNGTSQQQQRHRRKVRLPWTMMHPTADALDAAPETGLNSTGSFVLPTNGVLEHLEYHSGGARTIERREIMQRLATTEPLVYFVTPTYYRSTQMADMTRLAQTLMLDKRIYWIVIEDRNDCTIRIRALLERTGLPFAHLAVPTDPAVKAAKLVRGASQRNRGLEVVEQVNLPGVVYFGDDDNSYDGTCFHYACR